MRSVPHTIFCLVRLSSRDTSTDAVRARTGSVAIDAEWNGSHVRTVARPCERCRRTWSIRSRSVTFDELGLQHRTDGAVPIDEPGFGHTDPRWMLAGDRTHPDPSVGREPVE